MKTYRVYRAKDRFTLISEINLPFVMVENLSAETPEGFFMADCLPELAHLGDVVVFALQTNP